jgi:hypothetical protein
MRHCRRPFCQATGIETMKRSFFFFSSSGIQLIAHSSRAASLAAQPSLPRKSPHISSPVLPGGNCREGSLTKALSLSCLAGSMCTAEEKNTSAGARSQLHTCNGRIYTTRLTLEPFANAELAVFEGSFLFPRETVLRELKPPFVLQLSAVD